MQIDSILESKDTRVAEWMKKTRFNNKQPTRDAF